MNNDYNDNNTVYICTSCSISSSTATLPTSEGDCDSEDEKICRSSSNLRMNRLFNKSQKSSNSLTASARFAISSFKRRSIDYGQNSSLERISDGADGSEQTTSAVNIHQKQPLFISESLSSLKDEFSEHSIYLPMTTAIDISIKQENDE